MLILFFTLLPIFTLPTEAQAPTEKEPIEVTKLSYFDSNNQFGTLTQLAQERKKELERIEKEKIEQKRLHDEAERAKKERISAQKPQEQAQEKKVDKTYTDIKKNTKKPQGNKQNIIPNALPSGNCWDIAKSMTSAAFGEQHVGAMVTLIGRESGCNPNALNKSSGACGIPQALPCSKLPQGIHTPIEGQIGWMLQYIKARYGNPTQALSHSHSKGWY